MSPMQLLRSEDRIPGSNRVSSEMFRLGSQTVTPALLEDKGEIRKANCKRRYSQLKIDV